MMTICFIWNDYSAFTSIVNFDWHDISIMYKTLESCMKAIDACPSTFEICWKEWETELWCAQMTKCCVGWTNCCANVNSDVRNAPKHFISYLLRYSCPFSNLTFTKAEHSKRKQAQHNMIHKLLFYWSNDKHVFMFLSFLYSLWYYFHKYVVKPHNC